VDVLFNCAGWVDHGTILECSEIDWDSSFDINVKSMYRTCRAVLPGMLKAGKGNIVNVASGASSIKAAPNRFAYASTKSAVIGLTKSIAVDFIQQDLRNRRFSAQWNRLSVDRLLVGRIHENS